MNAILLNGKTVPVLEYGTATVLLKGTTRPVETTWSDIDYLLDQNGMMRQREIVEGMPTIIVQPLTPPSSVKYNPPPVQTDLLAPTPERTPPQGDVEDAKEILDLTEGEEVIKIVHKAIQTVFKDKKEKEMLWGKLNEDQQGKLKMGRKLNGGNS